MAKKGKSQPAGANHGVSAERAARLYRMLKLLGSGPRTRDQLLNRLGLEIRGFYRDLSLLRGAGIEVPLRQRRYHLDQSAAQALALLPFPDPCLTLGEAIQLSRGRTLAHHKLKGLIAIIVN